ncbi:hypothetical protein FRE64_11705 [Euhalothece natronophila Z-M001]|uniref:Tetratricopeptide repeat protein n=2 Tax=Euhalothece TaxID=65097 RepID=A0A5B8NPU5_9CHRO|nr:hypothetical protein FRE64_11705 [Euhalothece natronophila Z-M001]
MLLLKFQSVAFSILFVVPLLFSGMPAFAQPVTEEEAPDEAIEAPEEAPEEPIEEGDETIQEELPDDLRSDNFLSLSTGEQLMEQASEAIDEEDYETAKERLQTARRLSNQLSNFYQQLGGTFQGINTRLSEEQRQKAVQAARMRDRATYQLGLVHRSQQEPALAIPLFIQVIRSQNPTSELGSQAYQQLYDLGFVDTPLEN